MAVPNWFDETYYLANKLAQLQSTDPDTYTSMSVTELADVIAEAGMTPYEHFEHYGDTELVNPNQYFNAEEYFAAKTAQLNRDAELDKTDWTSAETKAAFAAVGLSAWDHYRAYGNAEDVNPSNGFDEQAYFAAKAAQLNARAEGDKTDWDVAAVEAAFEAAGLNAVEHFLMYGKNEGITVEMVASDDQVAPAAVMPSVRTSDGVVIDGRIKGATVFADLDGDGKQDANEPSVTTDEQGNFDANFTGLAANAPLVATGGTDIATNLPFGGAFTAPAGSTVVTPLTTLIQSLVDSGTPAAEAELNLKKAFGLPANLDLRTFDATNIDSATADEATQQAAVKVYAAAAQVANLMTQISGALQGAAGELSGADTFQSVAKAIAAQAQSAAVSGAILDLSDKDNVKDILLDSARDTRGVQGDALDDIERIADDAAEVMSNTNAKVASTVEAADDMGSAMRGIAKVQHVAQGEAVQSLQDGVSGGDLSGAKEQFQGDQLDQAISEADDDIGDVNVGDDSDNQPKAPKDDGDGGNGGNGGNGGDETPDEPIFTVTQGTGKDANVWTLSTQSGPVHITANKNGYTLAPESGDPVTITGWCRVESFVVNTITLTGSAYVLEGVPITGSGNVTVTIADERQNLNISTSGTNTIAGGRGADRITLLENGGEDTIKVYAGSAVHARTETYTLLFQALSAGQSVTVDGLTLTATGDISAADVAAGFANLPASATEGSAVTNGSWSGTLSADWSTAEANGAAVTFTSMTPDTNVESIDFSVAGTEAVEAPAAPASESSQGSAAQTETHTLTFQALSAGQSVTVDGLTLTADGNISAAEVAAGFASLSASATEGNTVTNGSWSGELSTNWSSAEASEAAVTFTSTTPDSNVTDLVVTTAGTPGVATPANIMITISNDGHESYIWGLDFSDSYFSASGNTHDIITNFQLDGTDKLDLNTSTLLEDTSTGEFGEVSFTIKDGIATFTGKPTTDDILTALATQMGEKEAVVAFSDGTNSYIFRGDGVAGLLESDIFIELAGVDVTDIDLGTIIG